MSDLESFVRFNQDQRRNKELAEQTELAKKEAEYRKQEANASHYRLKIEQERLRNEQRDRDERRKHEDLIKQSRKEMIEMSAELTEIESFCK
jgi:hypothetical protein